MDLPKKIFYLALGVLVVILILLLISKKDRHNSLISPSVDPQVDRTESTISHDHKIKVKGNELFVEIADTPEKRKAGLSGRSNLGKNEGMLFDFGIKDTYPKFWMKDMFISIDIIWIDNGRIIHIDKNLDPEDVGNETELTLYSPPAPIDHVLEVNAGYSDEHGLDVGHKVEFLF